MTTHKRFFNYPKYPRYALIDDQVCTYGACDAEPDAYDLTIWKLIGQGHICDEAGKVLDRELYYFYVAGNSQA